MAGEMGMCEEAREFALSKKLDMTFLLFLLLLLLLLVVLLLLSECWEGKEGNVCEGDKDEDEDAGSA